MRGQINNLLLSLTFCSNVLMVKNNSLGTLSLKENFMNNIKLRKVRNDWMPEGSGAAAGGVLPRFLGSPDDALRAFEQEIPHWYEYDEEPLASADTLLTDDVGIVNGVGYRKDKESIFLIHASASSAYHTSVRNIVTALALRRLIENEYNVFLFDMPKVMNFMVGSAFKSVFIPGINTELQELSQLLGDSFISWIRKGLINANQIHIVGFCFSAQLSGNIGRYVSAMNGGNKIKSITALDPFSLGLSGFFNKPISKDDAQLVHIYHTNSMAFGTFHRRGTADFIFNNGWTQPGCYFTLHESCSHWKALKYFWNVILYPDLWVARSCPSWLRFKFCLCNSRATVPITFPPMEGARGSHYLNTLAHKPYGAGPQAANCYMRKKEKAMP
ncbi:phospholipase A1-like [Macrosteles quadrilineatus]|uniref:phospholipase A1-like n=1 Tax=Macrosteles quadrilineatus TaxID=74068 RepID=UPI0023E30441|nr:phospholipase A1-like [Macrosteles quadrilineatus]